MPLPSFLGHARPAGLCVDNLSWGPSRQRPIIEGIDFSVEPGQMLAIVGPNGAGKSSLLRCLYRFHRPRTGRVLLDGADLHALSPKAAARRIACVLQEPAGDFGLTVAEVVELGLIPRGIPARHGDAAETAYRTVVDALALMGLTALAGRDFGSLSGGEKQRVMLARALAQQPDLIILDEPTNHLDIRHQLDVLALLSALPATVIVSLHDLALASSHADRVLVMAGGRQVDCGAPHAVLTPSAIRETFAVETLVDAHPATGRPRFSFHIENNHLRSS